MCRLQMTASTSESAEVQRYPDLVKLTNSYILTDAVHLTVACMLKACLNSQASKLIFTLSSSST